MQATFAKALGLKNETKGDIAVGMYRIEPIDRSHKESIGDCRKGYEEALKESKNRIDDLIR